MPRSLLLLGLLAACGVNEDNWGDQSADVECDYLKRCAAIEFFTLYDDMGECRDKKQKYWEDYGEQIVDGCKFSEDAANDCLDGLKQSCENVVDDYDDVMDACDQVWDCGNLYGN